MRMPTHLILLTLVCAWQVLPAQALPETISIKLFDAHPLLESVEARGPLKVITPSSTKVRSSEGTLKVIAARGAVLLYRIGVRGGKELIGSAPTAVIVPASYRGVEIVRSDGLRRRYLGQLQFTSAADARKKTDRRFVLSLIERTKSKDYLCSVLGSESPRECPEEALKALAIMILNRLETRARFQPLSDSTKEQLYFGSASVTPSVARVVDDMYSWRLFAGKTMIESYFSSTCAGGTSGGSAIFGKAARHLHYLKSVKCDYCTASPFWKRRVTSVREDRLVKILGGVPEVSLKDRMDRPVEVAIRPPSGRARIASGYKCWLELGRSLGWAAIPGTRYSFSKSSNMIEISSTGAGHGLGLCVWGAMGLADTGKSYKEILLYYFPTCHLQRV